jgi:alanine racemase
MDVPPADRQAVVDTGAITANVAALCRLVRGKLVQGKLVQGKLVQGGLVPGSQIRDRQVLAVVKADGYGHGMVAAARAALAGGAGWLGVADLTEAVALREAGITAPVLGLMAFGDPAEAVRRGIDVTAGSSAFVDAIAAAAERAGVTARLHLEADTGLSRGGATPADWPRVVEAALAAQARGAVTITGLWSHFACADIPGHPSIAAQLAVFTDAVAFAEEAGVTPEVRHIANTAAALTVPESRFDLVRLGGAIYGLSTLPGGAPSWLRPAMSLRSRLVMVKRVPAGTGVSYGYRWVTERETTLGLVPLGYADGVPRAAAGRPLVFARGRRWPIAGTVCMDQFVIDFGDEPAAVGDEVMLFGPGDHGEPTAQEWGEALGTISYDMATGIGARVPKTYPGETR